MQEQLRDGWRLTKPENLHVTILFLGDVPDPLVPCLIEEFAQLRLTNLDISFSDLVGFPQGGAVRAAAMRLSDRAEAWKRAHEVVSRGLARYVDQPDSRTYIPHITLARPNVQQVKPNVGALRRVKVSKRTWPVPRVSLFESVLTSSGPEYRALSSLPL